MGRTFAAGSSVTAVADICQSETGFVQVRFGQQGVFIRAAEQQKIESQGDANLLQHTGQMVVVKWKATADVPAHEMTVFHYTIVAQAETEVRKEDRKECTMITCHYRFRQFNERRQRCLV